MQRRDNIEANRKLRVVLRSVNVRDGVRQLRVVLERLPAVNVVVNRELRIELIRLPEQLNQNPIVPVERIDSIGLNEQRRPAVESTRLPERVSQDTAVSVRRIDSNDSNDDGRSARELTPIPEPQDLPMEIVNSIAVTEMPDISIVLTPINIERPRQLVVRLIRDDRIGVNEQLPVQPDGVEEAGVNDNEENINDPPRADSPIAADDDDDDDGRYLVHPHFSQEQPAPRRRHADVPHVRSYRSAIVTGNVMGFENDLDIFHVGEFRVFCAYCGAKFFEKERTNRQGVNLSCCKNGDIRLEALDDCPEVLHEYLTEESPMAGNFREEIRSVNSLFSMATFKTSIPADVNPVGVQGLWCFTIAGQIYHYCQAIPQIGAGGATGQGNLLNAQYYFVDVDEAVNRREGFIGDRVPRLTLVNIERMLREVNPLIQAYMTMAEVIRERVANDGARALENIVIAFKDGINRERRNFGLPQSRSEVAAIFEGEPPFQVDLVVYSRNRAAEGEHGRHELKNLNPLSDPMTYPLLFPRGERGYDYVNLRHQRNDKVVTFREFYRYRIQCRVPFSILHNSGKLFQQYVVDAWVKIEGNNLWYIRNNNIQLRLANYDKIHGFLERRAAEQGCRVGLVTILPASFMGGYRHQNRNYLDAVAVIARHGKPDLFITFTCSPKWPEITANLEHRQKYQNRPDLICRIFRVKLLEFIDDLVQKQLYGVVLNYFYVIEFQKRGLPHAHILVTFYPEDRLNDAEKVDQIICAEIPDVEAEPILYGVVAENYIHRVCAPVNMEAPCLQEGRCSKAFPKRYQEGTELNYHLTSTKDGRPEYRRRNDGRRIFIDDHGYTNRDVVPYNRYAALKYRCHINFEGVGSLASVKYLYKYVTKGVDMCSIELNGQNDRVLNWDEVKNYIDCRYVSSIEATWRILEFKLSDRSHAVVCLPVHLEDRQQVAFDEDEDEEEILARAGRETKLTAYFQLNRDDPDARLLKYIEIPENYVWHNTTQTWRRRVKRVKVIGNVCEVTATDSELYYLRTLMQHTRGATSFLNLRTLPDGRVCETYRETCEALHLFENVDFYRNVLEEAIVASLPNRLRSLYALIILISFDVGENMLARVVSLWPDFKDPHMIADFMHHDGARRSVALRRALNEIERILRRNRDELTLNAIGLIDDEAATDEEMQRFVAAVGDDDENDVRINIDVYDEEERQQLEANGQIYRVDLLTADQRQIYNIVIYAVLASQNLSENPEILAHFEITDYARQPLSLLGKNLKIFFVDGPAGTGKTFLYNVIIYKFVTQIKLHKLKILTVAYAGIAASLLYHGRTVHRAFKLPLEINEYSRVGWPYEHERSRELATIPVILWDEISMTSRFALEAADRYLRDITNNDGVPFGKKVMLFGGDFRQTLPIVKRGSPSLILAHSVKASTLWHSIQRHFKLEQNLRAQRSTTPAEASSYATWLLNLGEGKLPHVNVPAPNAPVDLVRVPRETIILNRTRLIEWVYGVVPNRDELNDRVILCPTNAVVDEMNREILTRLPGEPKTYFSVDKLERNVEDDFIVPQDLLHATTASNLPPHELTLKVGSVVILLRNLDISAGLCNGCRFVVRRMLDNMIELEVLTGAGRGRLFWLPKMILKSSVPELANPIRRVQFPLRLAFAMTINKSQGQTFARIGLHLPAPCFSHGQLYVAFSRVGNAANVKVSVINSTIQGCLTFRDGTILTRNVVYRAIFGKLRSAAINPIRTVPTNGGPVRGTAPGNTRNVADATRVAEDEEENIDPAMEIVLTDIDIDALVQRHLQEATILPVRARADGKLPDYSSEQLENRRSIFDRPGTSGIRRPPPPPPQQYDSDSD